MTEPKNHRSPGDSFAESHAPFQQYFLAATVIVGVTLPAFLLQPVIGHRAVSLIYLLTLVMLALFVQRGPSLFAAGMSSLFLLFFFIPPIGSFHISSAEDAFMFATYFFVALVLGQLTARIRAQERVERQRQEHATGLYLLARELLEATNLDELAQKSVNHLTRVFGIPVVMLIPEVSSRTGFKTHPASTGELSGPQQPLVGWVFEHGEPAGKFTAMHPKVDSLFLPLKAGGTTLAVLGLAVDTPIPSNSLLAALLQQIALALDRQRLREQFAKASLLAESERLSKTLLNSMSHEIRTPLAAIQSAVGNLREWDEPGLTSHQRGMVAEIQEAADRLNALVGKVLDITRLESGNVKPKLVLCDINDLVHVALKETRKALSGHSVNVDLAPVLPLVKADYGLLQQSLVNLLANAALHTPAGTAVQVSARAREGCLLLAVADRGPGIPAGSLEHVFEKFYRAPGAPTGGTGIGLSLVKGFVEAQGGTVTAENRLGGGAAFTIRLPLGQAVAAQAAHGPNRPQTTECVVDRG